MKLRIALACIILALAFAAIAITSLRWGILATMAALALGSLGIGLLEEAMRPGDPNPRTQSEEHQLWLEEMEARYG